MEMDPEQWKKITTDPVAFQTYVVQTLSIIEATIEKIKGDVQEIKKELELDED